MATDRVISLRIADIHVRLRILGSKAAGSGRGDTSWFRLSEVYEAFRYSGPAEVDIVVRLEPPPPIQGRPVFASGSTWQFYESDGAKWVATFIPRDGGRVVDRLGIFSADFTRGEIYVAPPVTDSSSASGSANRVLYPLNYPLDEVLFINLLSQGRGVELHACGVSMGEQGLLFVGPSGAGKSTIARLMRASLGVVVLSDDRTIVRRIGERWLIFGTPWHGQAKALAAVCAELTKIFVLRRSATNEARRIPRLQGASELVARSFPTYWDAAGMRYTLGLVDELTSKVPIYELGFAPTPACVEFVRGV
jgi:hypothetical protein